ncbi:MAG TPA: GatB/YqeY domain-containing protein [Micropepsaceae bacterium]|nr:GatB/YqeY domain-containing protein [Micropepsaceae bacterium]
MALKERITEAMKAALKAKETKRLSAVRLMLAAIQQQEIVAKSAISDDEILTVLARMIKQREESAATYDSGGRPELAQGERDEIVVIREFMPQQLSAEETAKAVKETIAALGAASMKDMGKVMAALKEHYSGQMDFAKASALVKEQLSAPK